jgi:hypothetical protein
MPDIMNIPLHFELGDDFARFRPQGDLSLVEAVDAVTSAIAFCRDRDIRKLLVDSTGLPGIVSLTLADRFWMAQDFAQAAQGKVIVAMVATPAQIHPKKFGVMAANDAGLVCTVSASESEAIQWLLSH